MSRRDPAFFCQAEAGIRDIGVTGVQTCALPISALLLRGDPSEIPFSAGALVPDVRLENVAFLGGVILLFPGMEMAGFHARETADPGRTVPRAIALAVAVTVAFSVLGSLFMAFVVPQREKIGRAHV